MKPMFMSFDLTYNCNLRCKHCYNSSGENHCSRNELSDTEVLRVAKQLALAGPESICFCGGEPLIRKEIMLQATKLIKEIDNKINVNMVSNSLLFEDEDFIRFKEAGITLVQISLDGYNPETHDWMRNKSGVFNKAIDTLKKLKNYGFISNVSFVPTKKNVNEIINAINLCEELGVYSFRVQPLMLLGRTNKYLNDFVLDDYEYRKLAHILLERKKENMLKGKMEISWGDPTFHLLNLESNMIQPSIVINAYGDLVLSPYVPISFGNLLNNDLQKYIEAGLLNEWTGNLYKFLTRYVNSPKSLDLSKFFPNGMERLDILDDNFKSLENILLSKFEKIIRNK